MAVAFSTDNSGVFEEKISQDARSQNGGGALSPLQLENCKTWINNGGYRRVALQFPDEYLHSAGKVVQYLERVLEGLEVFVLADTSYGSCCVDEVAAEHGHADCILHAGHSCLSPTRRLPVLYVFGEMGLDVETCCNKIREHLCGEAEMVNVALVYDVTLHHCMGTLHKRLQTDFPKVLLSHFQVASNAKILSSTLEEDEDKMADQELVVNNCVKCGGRTLYLPQDRSIGDYTILYIGPESMALSNLMMTWNKSAFYRYDPTEQVVRKETVNVSRLLTRRYFLVEKAKDARIVGILVGTLGVANYIEIIDKMKCLLKKAGKKYYTFVVGKLNVAKLANFMEIDVYVYVSCAENILVDSKDFYRPIVTPYEMEIACNPKQQWTGDYVGDFQQLLPGGESYMAVPERNIEEHMDVSLITGHVRQMGVNDPKSSVSSSQALLERGDNIQVANSAGDFLGNRSWRGLEPKLGETPVVKATKGRKGIAISYENEPT